MDSHYPQFEAKIALNTKQNFMYFMNKKSNWKLTIR